jgi:hypothetical protein
MCKHTWSTLEANREAAVLIILAKVLGRAKANNGLVDNYSTIVNSRRWW